MKEIKEYTAQVLERSEKRIKERKRNRNKILLSSIPLLVLITVFSVILFPSFTTINEGETAENDTIIEEYAFAGDNKYESQSNSMTDNSSKAENANASPNFKSETTKGETTKGDLRGTIIYNGKKYNQISNDVAEEIISKLHIDKYIGNARSFEGTYRDVVYSDPHNNVDGKVYTVKEDSSLLLIHLDNSGTVLLKAEE